MSQLTAISDALDFVERHLKQDIGVADMASAAGYSLYHFCRVFNSLVRHTPYDYLMRRRLSESAQTLLATDWNIVDVAFEYRFNSHEAFTRAFKRMFGVSPSRYRDEETPLDWRAWLPPLSIEYLRHINEGDGLKPTLVERSALQLTGLMALARDNVAIAHLWEILGRELAQIGSAGQDWEFYGVTWYSGKGRREDSFYLAAVDGKIDHPALVMKTLPPLTCARFVHQGPRSALPFTQGYIHHTWLPQSGVSRAFPLEIEYYAHRLPDHENHRWEILIPIE